MKERGALWLRLRTPSPLVESRSMCRLLAGVRQIEIMDSIAPVEMNVRARVGGMFSRSKVSVSTVPSRRLAAAPG